MVDKAGSWRSLLALLALLGGLLLAAGAEAEDEIFVLNNLAKSVTVYSRTASGNTVPNRILLGPATELFTPGHIALNPVSNELFVVDSDTIHVFNRTASGNTAPLRNLSGPATGLSSPQGIVLDPEHNEMFVANGAADSVTVYNLTASGNTAPLRTIQGPGTGLAGPEALALDLTNNEVWVASGSGNGKFTAYPRTASGNATPLRTLTANMLSNPEDLAIDPAHDELFVVNNAGHSIDVYARTASGSTSPLRRLQGAATGLTLPSTAVLDLGNDELIVGNTPPANSVTVYSRAASGNTAPLRTLQGPATGLNGPSSLRLTPKLGLLATLNKSTFQTAETMSQTLGVGDAGLPGTADFYMGNLWPNRVIQFFSGGGLVFGSLDNLASFHPLATGVPLTTPFSVIAPSFFNYQWTGAEVEGGYVFFILALTGGALNDGVVSPGEVLGIATAPYFFAVGKP